MNVLSRLLRDTSLFCFFLFFVCTACESLVETPEEGSLQLALISTTAEGDRYILQNTTIRIMQQSTLVTTLQSDDLDVTETTLSAELAAGDYSSLLLEGWQVAELHEDGTTTPKKASLRGGPDRPVSIAMSSTTTLNYVFDIPGETIVFGGTLEVGFEVKQNPPELTGKAPGPCSTEVDDDGDGIADSLYTYEYDAAGNEIEFSTDWHADGKIDETVFRAYDAMGRVIRERVDVHGDGDLDTGHDWQYDSNGNLIAEYDYYEPPFDNNHYKERTINEYDSAGRIILSEVDRGTPGDGIVDSRTVHTYSDDGLLQTSTHEDADGEVTTVTANILNADGKVLESKVDGLFLSDVDGSWDMKTTSTYDADGRPIKNTVYIGEDDTIYQINTYEYDNLGNEIYSSMTQLEAGRTETTISEYDSYGNLLKSTHASSSEENDAVTLTDYSCFASSGK